MTSPSYTHCPHDCGEFRDTSGRYTSPANQERDRKWWQDEHLSGKCKATPAEEATAEPVACSPRIGDPGVPDANQCELKETAR